MAKNRKAAEDFIKKFIHQILPDGKNLAIYKDLFKNMSDKQFDDFMMELKEGKRKLVIIAPNMADVELTVERNLEVADALGHNFFQRIWINQGNDVPPYLSPIPYLVIDLPLRRQAQLIDKKKSIPEDNKSVDELTGQPTGKSKGSAISFPESQILRALDLNDSLVEMLKNRGGDTKAFIAMNNAISKTGGVSIKEINKTDSVVTSTQNLHIILTSMHLKNSLLGKSTQ